MLNIRNVIKKSILYHFWLIVASPIPGEKIVKNNTFKKSELFSIFKMYNVGNSLGGRI